ncbi:MAG: hypothetical protein ACLQOO_20885 [Terriglobia bacterium]
MRKAPTAVIHINFLSGLLLFQPERVWTALRRGQENGRVSESAATKLLTDLGNTAIHLATRDYLIRAAVKQLTKSLAALADLNPEPWLVPRRHGYRVIGNAQIYEERDRALSAVDSVLFEFRSYLELLATFMYEFLVGIGRPPASKIRHSSGEELTVVDKRGKLRTHNFLRHLCDELSCPEDWYLFLSEHRNFFTHNGAPYIAIEDRLVRPPEFDFLIMRTNIHDFENAQPGDYFRLSEFQGVVEGVKRLARTAQQELVTLLEG